MDTNTTANTAIIVVAVIALFAVIIVGFVIVYRRRGQAEIKGPLGLGLKVGGSNEPTPPTPAVTVEDVKSRSGGLVAEDTTGRGAAVKGADVKDDILVSSTPPAKGPDPKD